MKIAIPMMINLLVKTPRPANFAEMLKEIQTHLLVTRKVDRAQLPKWRVQLMEESKAKKKTQGDIPGKQDEKSSAPSENRAEPQFKRHRASVLKNR